MGVFQLLLQLVNVYLLWYYIKIQQVIVSSRFSCSVESETCLRSFPTVALLLQFEPYSWFCNIMLFYSFGKLVRWIRSLTYRHISLDSIKSHVHWYHHWSYQKSCEVLEICPVQGGKYKFSILLNFGLKAQVLSLAANMGSWIDRLTSLIFENASAKYQDLINPVCWSVVSASRNGFHEKSE